LVSFIILLEVHTGRTMYVVILYGIRACMYNQRTSKKYKAKEK